MSTPIEKKNKKDKNSGSTHLEHSNTWHNLRKGGGNPLPPLFSLPTHTTCGKKECYFINIHVVKARIVAIILDIPEALMRMVTCRCCDSCIPFEKSFKIIEAD